MVLSRINDWKPSLTIVAMVFEATPMISKAYGLKGKGIQLKAND